jgi:hypothetical protein
MRVPRLLLLTVVCLAGPGCGLLRFGNDDTTYVVENGGTPHGPTHELVDGAWNRFRSANPSYAFSEDFAHGFRSGFVDSREFGGTGQPPWYHIRTSCQPVEGYQAMKNWFDGFQAGAAAAHGNGVVAMAGKEPVPSMPVNEPMRPGGRLVPQPMATPVNQPISQAPASEPNRVLAVVWIPPGQSAPQGTAAQPMKVVYTAPAQSQAEGMATGPRPVAAAPSSAASHVRVSNAPFAGSIVSHPVVMNFAVPMTSNAPVRLSYVGAASPPPARPAAPAGPAPVHRVMPTPVSQAPSNAAVMQAPPPPPPPRAIPSHAAVMQAPPPPPPRAIPSHAAVMQAPPPPPPRVIPSRAAVMQAPPPPPAPSRAPLSNAVDMEAPPARPRATLGAPPGSVPVRTGTDAASGEQGNSRWDS